MEALYAFARRTDDLVDDASDAESAQVAIASWRDDLTTALSHQSSPVDPILQATADAVTRFRIPPENLFAIVDGVARDAHPCGPVFETFDDLRGYCRQVASAVGIACLYIWGFRGGQAQSQTLLKADACGIAFQLVNIARDLREDANRGRCYVPRADLRDLGLREIGPLRDNWLATASDEQFVGIVKRLTDRARDFFAQASGLDREIESPGKHLYRLMSHRYQLLRQRIVESPGQVRHGRIRLGWAGRLSALGKTIAGVSP